MTEKDPIDEILRKAAEMGKIVNAPAQPLPPRLLRQINAMLAKPATSAGVAADTNAVNEGRTQLIFVNILQMKLLILERLEMPMDGLSIIRELRKGNFKIGTNHDAFRYKLLQEQNYGKAVKGLRGFLLSSLRKTAERTSAKLTSPDEGAIYGILRSMERSKLLKAEWREVSSRIVKVYCIAPKGNALLENSGAAIANLGGFFARTTASEAT